MKIDRSKWEPCYVCGKTDEMRTETYSTEIIQGLTVTTNYHVKAKYCSNCGRPLTEEAWQELERRFNLVD